MANGLGPPQTGFWESGEAEANSHQRFRTLVSVVDDGIYQLDADGRFIAVNETIVEETGYTPEKLLGEHVSLLLDETDCQRAEQHILELLRNDQEEPATLEITVITASGDTLPCQVSIGLLTDDGELQGTIGHVRNIREQKRLQRQRERELEQYRALTEAANDVIVTIDEDSIIQSVNPAVEDVFGYHPDELNGESLTILMPDDLVDVHRDGLERYLETNERTLNWGSIELPGRHAEGSEIPLSISFGEVEYRDERYFTGIIRDITRQKKRERQLQESRSQLRALIDVLPVGVFVAESDGKIVEWNDAAEEIWGGEIAESDSIAEYSAYDGWWADTGDPVEPEEWPLARALQGEEVTDPDEIIIEGFDGKERTILNHGMPVREVDGDVKRAVVTIIDITERKEYERKLEESNKRLEQFAYAASHDLQEPLRMVSSYLRLLEQRYADQLDEDGEEFLEFAVDGADRMRNMIHGLLEYSRIETKGDEFEPVDLDEVLTIVREDLSLRIEESDATITAEALPVVEGDGEQLRRLLQNLIENAIEYSGEERPRIQVGAERSGDKWVVSVVDNGIGIEPESTDDIFRVFQRLHSHDQHEGSGIGLALCRRIVERHGGRIWVESEPGEGSTFSFTLPATDSG